MVAKGRNFNTLEKAHPGEIFKAIMTKKTSVLLNIEINNRKCICFHQVFRLSIDYNSLGKNNSHHQVILYKEKKSNPHENGVHDGKVLHL